MQKTSSELEYTGKKNGVSRQRCQVDIEPVKTYAKMSVHVASVMPAGLTCRAYVQRRIDTFAKSTLESRSSPALDGDLRLDLMMN